MPPFERAAPVSDPDDDARKRFFGRPFVTIFFLKILQDIGDSGIGLRPEGQQTLNVGKLFFIASFAASVAEYVVEDDEDVGFRRGREGGEEVVKTFFIGKFVVAILQTGGTQGCDHGPRAGVGNRDVKIDALSPCDKTHAVFPDGQPGPIRYVASAFPQFRDKSRLFLLRQAVVQIAEGLPDIASGRNAAILQHAAQGGAKVRQVDGQKARPDASFLRNAAVHQCAGDFPAVVG